MKKMILASVGVLALTAMFTTAQAAVITIGGNQALQGQTGVGELVEANNGAGNSATAIQLRNGYTLTVETNAVVNLTSGMNISQGVNGDGANITIDDGGTLNIGTSLSMSGNATSGGTSFFTMAAGGTLDITDNMTVGTAFDATFEVVGAGSTIDVGGAVNAKVNSIFDFTLDETGVSAIDVTGDLTITAGSALNVDYSAYTGTDETVTLFTLTDTSVVTGLDNWEGASLVGNNVVVAIPEPATIGMLGLGTVGLLAFRRRM